MRITSNVLGKIMTTYETKTRFVECAICKRITSTGHAENFADLWICCWCGQ
tara:strand:+ start:200 stop:352 length:153 start_codon:yes stop_codon:yes gene_type:complete